MDNPDEAAILPPEEEASATKLGEIVSPDRLDMGIMNGLLGFQLRLASVAVQQDFSQVMAPLALTQMQAAVMILVHQNPGVSQVALAAALDTDRATMMGVVDRLEARELLRRTRSTEDRRRQELHLTRKGGALLKKAKAVIDAHEQKFLQLLNPDERAALFVMLKRVYRR